MNTGLNLGNYEQNSKILELQFGVFFDGTLNNKKNTELRLKYLTNEKTTKDLNKPIKAIDSTHLIQAKLNYQKQVKEQQNKLGSKIKKENNGDEYLDFLKASYEKDLKNGDESGNSFSNDFTNVARKYMCCNTDYAIYVEGIGTLDNREDEENGSAFGSGKTGILEKVNKGIDLLIKKITNYAYLFDDNDTLIIKVDVFGFSRGSAAARNFINEINCNPKHKARVDKHVTNDIYGNTQIVNVFSNNRKQIIFESILINGDVPPYGNLGLQLLSKGVLKKEDFKNLYINIRFVGIYETVSSYKDVSNSYISKKLFNGLSLLFEGSFNNNKSTLNLNSLGKVTQLVHFTALDEKRKFFDLTRLPKGTGIEKDFPGVHSDVGGSYNTGFENIKKLNSGEFYYSTFIEKLYNEYWFRLGEAKVFKESDKYHVKGNRFLWKEYSYIPLHFMCYYAKSYMNQYFIKDVTSEYSLVGHQILIDIKEKLHDYITNPKNHKNEWIFKTDEDLLCKQPTFTGDKIDIPKPSILRNHLLFRSTLFEDDKLTEINDLDMIQNSKIEKNNFKNIDLIQYYLRELRMKYLHYSSNYEGTFGTMQPRKSGRRIIE